MSPRNFDQTCVGSITFITIRLTIDLPRFPDIQAKVVPLMKDYLLALRSKDDTPSPLLMTSRTSEEDVLDSFKAEIVAKQAGNQIVSHDMPLPCLSGSLPRLLSTFVI